MDVISIRDIRAYGRHGANPGERDSEQPFDIDVHLELDLCAASQSDDLAATVNYAVLHERIVRIVRQHSFALLERLAAELLLDVFRDPRIARASVQICKPKLLEGATPCVRLARENPRFVQTWP